MAATRTKAVRVGDVRTSASGSQGRPNHGPPSSMKCSREYIMLLEGETWRLLEASSNGGSSSAHGGEIEAAEHCRTDAACMRSFSSLRHKAPAPT